MINLLFRLFIFYRSARPIFLGNGCQWLQIDVFILVYSYSAHREIPPRSEPGVYGACKLVDTALNRDGHDVVHL